MKKLLIYITIAVSVYAIHGCANWCGFECIPSVSSDFAAQVFPTTDTIALNDTVWIRIKIADELPLEFNRTESYKNALIEGEFTIEKFKMGGAHIFNDSVRLIARKGTLTRTKQGINYTLAYNAPHYEGEFGILTDAKGGYKIGFGSTIGIQNGDRCCPTGAFGVNMGNYDTTKLQIVRRFGLSPEIYLYRATEVYGLDTVFHYYPFVID
jgi:hypothetical protein